MAWLNNVDAFLRGESDLRIDKDGEPTDQELRIAVIALLIKMAGADSRVHAEELGQIFSSVQDAFGMDRSRAGELGEIADALQKDAARTQKLVETINNHLSTAQKQIVLSMIWKVVSSDGKVDSFETRYASELRNLLGLTLEQAVSARKLAEP